MGHGTPRKASARSLVGLNCSRRKHRAGALVGRRSFILSARLNARFASIGPFRCPFAGGVSPIVLAERPLLRHSVRLLVRRPRLTHQGRPAGDPASQLSGAHLWPHRTQPAPLVYMAPALQHSGARFRAALVGQACSPDLSVGLDARCTRERSRMGAEQAHVAQCRVQGS